MKRRLVITPRIAYALYVARLAWRESAGVITRVPQAYVQTRAREALREYDGAPR